MCYGTSLLAGRFVGLERYRGYRPEGRRSRSPMMLGQRRTVQSRLITTRASFDSGAEPYATDQWLRQ